MLIVKLCQPKVIWFHVLILVANILVTLVSGQLHDKLDKCIAKAEVTKKYQR